MTYQAYAPRVLDAKVQVDRYLQATEDGDREVRRLLEEAIGLHALASLAWNARLVDTAQSYEAVGRSPLIERCPRIQIGNAMSRDAFGRGLALAFGGVRELWGCASDRLVEAERLLLTKPTTGHESSGAARNRNGPVTPAAR